MNKYFVAAIAGIALVAVSVALLTSDLLPLKRLTPVSCSMRTAK